MRRLFKFRYPKITLLILLSIISYFIFSNATVERVIEGLNGLSYVGIFIAGMFFSFGFSTPFSVGFFIVAAPENIFYAAAIGGFGAFLSDMLIFKLIRFSFMNEFKRLEKTALFVELHQLMHSRLLSKIRVYLLFAFAGIVIASPLPDEVGVSMLAGLTHIKMWALGLISFVMNFIGILIMLLL